MAAKSAPGVRLYLDRDMVAVVDDTGAELPAVPKAWIGTDLIPAGVVKAGKADPVQVNPVDPTVEPNRGASTALWVAFAKAAKGATDADLVDADGKPLTRDGLVEKYGSPAAPAGD